MLASNDNSYMKEYVRRQRVRATRDVNGRPGGVAGEKLLTDRGEYIRFLESQLDAVTQACLTAQSFDERILSLGAASVAHDEKILNLARLIKCSQGVAEEQEAAYRAAMDRVHRRVAECERAARETAETERRKILAARALLAKKGLVGGAEAPGADGTPNGTSHGTPTAALDVGVLDAQFRAWAEAHERATDARLLAAENRLAARVDAAVADVLDAVRNAERRLAEDAPRLAEDAARTVWGKIGGERGTLPRGGVASGGDVRDVAERVSRCEANDDELRAQMRAVRELQQTHQRRLETLRDETARLERRAATEPRARGGDEEFAGFWPVSDATRAGGTDPEVGDALARSVEASARGFERLDAQFAELRARLDARDADAARLAEAVETLRAAAGADRAESNDATRPAAMLMAEASALRAARTSVERAIGLRAVRTSPANSRWVSPEHSPDRATTRGAAAASAAKEEENQNRDEESDAGFERRDGRGEGRPGVFAETDARREKLARLYRRLEEIASPQPKG